LDTPVFDFHVHAGRWGNKTADDDVGRILKAMDAAGVDRCNVNCIFHGDAKRGNDIVSRLVAAHPDRFVGVAFVTPHYPGETVAELERAFDTLGMKSLKLYPTYFQRPIDDPGYLHIFEWCNERGVVIMSHSSYVGDHDMLSNPHRFIALAQRYDRIRWVLAHSGNSAIGQKQAVEAAQECPNIYLETCTSFGEHGTIEYLVEGAGPDRVLYGSDIPLMDPRLQVGRIVTADIPDEVKLKVLGLNAIKLLGLDE
jgi:predicted TIM-barrel fold metal-dependent hydrolase